jgi:hypothetical protein
MVRPCVAFLLAFLICLALLPGAGADWTGQAEVETVEVHVNFSERLTVRVVNTGSSAIEIVSVAVTINWDNMPTLYHVFDGSAILAPGEGREFTSPATRMPNVVTGTYICFAGVVAKGADGVAVEHRFPATITASQFSLTVLGVPEEFMVPLLTALVSVLITALLFRWERSPRWPFLRAVPRWSGHQLRRI